MAFAKCGRVDAKWLALEDDPIRIGSVCLGVVPATLVPTRPPLTGQVWPPKRRPRGVPLYLPKPRPMVPIAPADIDMEPDVDVVAEPIADGVVDDDEVDILADFVEEEGAAFFMPAEPVVPEEPGGGDGDGGPEAAPGGDEEGAPAAADGAPEAAVRVPAAASVVFPSGARISFDGAGDREIFEATCKHPDHVGCAVTRTRKATGRNAAGMRVGGRLLGFMAAWLRNADCCPNKAAHWTNEKLNICRADREAARMWLYGLEGADGLVEKERERDPGEPEEPYTMDGMLGKKFMA